MNRMASLERSLGETAEATRLTARVVDSVRELAARPDASALHLCLAGQALANAEPPQLRYPKLAVSYAEKCAARSGRLNPESLRIHSLAYRAAGRMEDSRKVAREGLALMPSGKHRGEVRHGLEELAR